MTLNFLLKSLFAFFLITPKEPENCVLVRGKGFLDQNLEHAPWRGQTRIKDQARHTSTDVCDGLFNVSFTSVKGVPIAFLLSG